jgi:hypothetical protein
MIRLRSTAHAYFARAVLCQSVHGQNIVRGAVLTTRLCSDAEKAITGKIKLNACVVARQSNRGHLRSNFIVVLLVSIGRIEKRRHD